MIRPEDEDLEEHSIVADLGEYGVVFDGEAYFGTYWPSEYDYSEMGTYEQAYQWCLDSIQNGSPIKKAGPET